MEGVKVCQEAIDLIKEFESLHDGDLSKIGLQPKLCPAGVWTVGFGSALRDHNGNLLRGKEGMDEAYRQYGYLTEEGAEELLAQDLAEFAKGVADCIDVELSPEQFGACVSLAYNIGLGDFPNSRRPGGFRASTVRRKINEGDFKGAADAFLMWNKSNGKVLAGLVRRRKAERLLFLKGTN